MKIKATANTESFLWVTDVGACLFNSCHTGLSSFPLSQVAPKVKTQSHFTLLAW